jgi:two-component system OmpR family sensor kinase
VISLCAAIVLVGVSGAAVAYFQVSHQTKHLLDEQMRQVAAVAASRVVPGTHGDDAIQLEVWNPDGSRLYATNPALQLPRSQPLGFSDVELVGEPYRVFRADFPDRSVAVAQKVDARDDQAEGAAVAALTSALLMLPVLALIMAGVVSVLLRPLREAAQVVAERAPLSTETLNTAELPREIAPLVEAINRLLERQHAALEEESAFLTDAAHALRTPLAALQLQVDVLDGSSDPSERQSRLAALRAGIKRAARLSEQLLAVARTPASATELRKQVQFDAILEEACDLYRAIAADAQLQLRLQAHSGASLHCNPRDLLVIFGNLLDNAIRFAPGGSVIDVLSMSDGGTVRAEVRDCGPGLAAASPKNTPPRTDAIERPGGFGLRAVQNVTARLGGEVELLRRSDRASGLVVRVTLPLLGRAETGGYDPGTLEDKFL